MILERKTVLRVILVRRMTNIVVQVKHSAENSLKLISARTLPKWARTLHFLLPLHYIKSRRDVGHIPYNLELRPQGGTPKSEGGCVTKEMTNVTFLGLNPVAVKFRGT